ncbi:hypothetical protein HPC37_09035 [Pasteurellaceae bacterium 20609_3]|nr:hypothetical protein [Spirabiliibacterium mucosae]
MWAKIMLYPRSNRTSQMRKRARSREETWNINIIKPRKKVKSKNSMSGLIIRAQSLKSRLKTGFLSEIFIYHVKILAIYADNKNNQEILYYLKPKQ